MNHLEFERRSLHVVPAYQVAKLSELGQYAGCGYSEARPHEGVATLKRERWVPLHRVYLLIWNPEHHERYTLSSRSDVVHQDDLSGQKFA